MNLPSEIILRLQNIQQLFRKKNDLFFCRRWLNKDAEEYLMEEASAIPRNTPINIVLYLQQPGQMAIEQIQATIQKHFAYQREKSEKKIKYWLHLGWKSLLVAFLFVGMILILTEMSKQFFAESGLTITIRESLIIIAWVALWRPADLLLYEWRPFKRQANLFAKLEKSTVQVVIEQ